MDAETELKRLERVVLLQELKDATAAQEIAKCQCRYCRDKIRGFEVFHG